MKMQRKTLLAGAAVLVLMVGTGLASAQEQKPSKQPESSSQSLKSSGAPRVEQQSGAGSTGGAMGENAQSGGHKMGMKHSTFGGKSTAQQHEKGMERYGQSTSAKGEGSTKKAQHAQDNEVRRDALKDTGPLRPSKKAV